MSLVGLVRSGHPSGAARCSAESLGEGPGALRSLPPAGSSHGSPQGSGTVGVMLRASRVGPGDGEGEAEEP